MSVEIQEFFDPDTFTLTYVVFDEKSKDSLILDPVLGYDPASSKVSFKSCEQVIRFIKEKNLNPHYALETHAHADHISSAQKLKEFFPDLKVGIGEKITEVQSVFKDVFNLDDHFTTDGKQFDILLKENQPLVAGTLNLKPLFTPGHTPACASYLIEDNLFTGDALFMPDYGTGRCDFPKGSAQSLYQSITQKIYTLPGETKIFVGHDYLPNGRELQFQTTVTESKTTNIRINETISEEEFIQVRENRDNGLKAPRLLLPSIQLNINAGKFPEPESNGLSYIKMPLKI